jgi:carbamate kinase
MIAMGGNSLSPKGEAGTISQQFSHTRETLEGIGHFIERVTIFVSIMVMVPK